EREGCITEQRQSRVVPEGRMLVGIGGVGQGAGEQLAIPKLMLQPTLELGDTVGIHFSVGEGDV
ncbi:MAG: hypothetical protein ACRDGH_14970, partial [Candidatus Limnocylindria bacterium]